MTTATLDAAARRLDMAFAALDGAHREIRDLAAQRARRRWTADEYDSYLRLLRSQRRALRRYMAAQRAFDIARHRDLRGPDT